MQNKGLVKFIAIVFALVSIYQLSFTFVTNHYESNAKEFSKGDLTKEARYLDSISNEKVYLGKTFAQVRSEQIQKGLDLEGGINVMLQISVKDILKGLANDSKNAVFNQALSEAEKNRDGNQTYLESFYESFETVSAGKVKLSSSEIFANRNLQEVNPSMSDAQVKTIINAKVKEAIESAYRVFGERIDKFGVVSPTIQMVGESGRILVELPGAKDIDRIKNLLQSTAQLEFWETYKSEQLGDFVFAANAVLKEKNTEKPAAVVANDSTAKPKTDVDKLITGVSKDTTANTQQNLGPILSLIQAPGYQGSPIIAFFATKDTAQINTYLKDPQVRGLLNGELRYVKFAWGKPKKEANIVELYALKGNVQNAAPLSGSVVTEARDDYDQVTGKPVVSMQMNANGAKIWEELTGKAYSQQSNIAIVLDNVVYSAPGVTTGAISGGNSSISGDFTVQETKDLANILKAGKLPASVDIVSSEIVGPSLGQAAIDAGMTSSVVGLIIIALWMVFFYGKSGWFANIALAVNLLFIFGILASIGAVLTLPGIAGIVLTIGTAVDANILIYERAKESLRAGQTSKEAIKHAFSWSGAMSAITDANVTTALTGLVLLIFGSGPIKGFATTLLIGIATSVFTAIVITRLLVDWAEAKDSKLSFSTKITKNWFTNINFDFLGKKKIAYVFTTITMLLCVGTLFINGLNYGIDFTGGRTFQVQFDNDVDASSVSNKLSKVFDSNVEAKIFGKDSKLKITTKYKVDEESAQVDQEVNKILYDNLKPYFKTDLTYEQFTHPAGSGLGIVQASKVGPTVAKDVKTDAYWAVGGALLVVFVYLAISFRRWQYSLGAVVAVAHDVLLVLGVYSFFYKFAPFNMEVDQSLVAALLTVIGYSLNDTVIVFDRVRDFIRGDVEGSFEEVVNKSINTTLSRTFNTSATVILILLIMFIFGGESIRGFVFAMLLGIGVGTYSSLFISTPILVDTIKGSAERERAEALKAKQEAENSEE
ncbi:protein translocase subunit SecDF [Flavobacterium sp. CBA20B-1]|uniref:protein translocase subunit SecDF n=1 Tax=unclassified Flavobacterium TaxID=196869 RepID=UPI0022250992|nr:MULTISPECIES: protein translocase subunit SecDF [unclassified Flavobacterium]WCM42201.1 protein translocase subunit SecDF [Flavobacterium sp. CBA20B-1]